MSKKLDGLRERVHRANLELVEAGLVVDTFGNVSGLDRDAGVMVIKPSGVPYAELTPDNLVAVDLSTGKALDTALRPSSDTPTHLVLYRAFPCEGVAHSHSEFATTLAQARLPVRCMGTTHADYFRGYVPVTRDLSYEEIQGDYEMATGRVIVESFRGGGISPLEVPGVLVAHHGPFTWGESPHEAVKHSVILEYVARMDWALRSLPPEFELRPPSPALVDRHFLRKHGGSAYYGQG